MAEELNNSVEANIEKIVESPIPENVIPKDIRELPDGKALTVEGTYRITSSQRVKFILLLGPSDSGKTTLVTTIYHLFQKDALAGYLFAGSETLLGFEQRAYNHRTHSGNTSPKAVKTRRGILDVILHLRLFKDNLLHDLMISDFSGEDYKAIIANVALAKSEFKIIKRADHIVLFVDGDLISQKKYRNGAEQESLQLLKTIVDADLISDNACVDILISKYDLILQRVKDDSSINDFIKKLKNKFEDQFKHKLKHLRVLNIAAMPDDAVEHKPGYGFNELIPCWAEDCSEFVSDFESDIGSGSVSEFNSFAVRVNRK